MTRRPSIGIVGTGLIGASIGLRAAANGARVLGWDNDERALAQAVSRGAVSAGASLQSVMECDVVVLAAPPNVCVTLLRSFALRLHFTSLGMTGDDALLRHGRLIVDVASVKVPVVEAGRGLHGFVGTHPFAGKEKSGAESADAGLFEGCTWAYVRSGDDALDAAAVAFIESMGALPFAVDAETHDRVVAYTSHLPQLFGYLFAEALDRIEPAQCDTLSGPVARELRRVAGSNRTLWREILSANRVHVASAARALADRLREAADALDAGGAPV